jgi:hypothetical protein
MAACDVRVVSILAQRRWISAMTESATAKCLLKESSTTDAQNAKMPERRSAMQPKLALEYHRMLRRLNSCSLRNGGRASSMGLVSGGLVPKYKNSPFSPLPKSFN